MGAIFPKFATNVVVPVLGWPSSSMYHRTKKGIDYNGREGKGRTAFHNSWNRIYVWMEQYTNIMRKVEWRTTVEKQIKIFTEVREHGTVRRVSYFCHDGTHLVYMFVASNTHKNVEGPDRNNSSEQSGNMYAMGTGPSTKKQRGNETKDIQEKECG